jgi:hypothetical protein
MNEIIAARNVLLETHYGRFNSLVKDGPEWLRLAESGSVWDSIYNIRNKELWMAAQRKIEERVNMVGKRAAHASERPTLLTFCACLSAHYSHVKR